MGLIFIVIKASENEGESLLFIGVEKKKPLLIGFSLFPEIHLTELILNVLGKSCVVLINFVTLFWTFHLWICS